MFRLHARITRGLVVALLALAGSGARAQMTLAENTSGIQFGPAVPGQSVTTPAGGPFNSLAFNFFQFETGVGSQPVANGTLFLLSQAYTGTPAGLSSATAGFIAQATGTGVGGAFTFDPGVTLQDSTQYFFYANTGQGSVLSNFTGNPYAGGNAYFASPGFISFAPADFQFRLTGQVAPAQTVIPEPGTLALLASGILSVGGLALRRRQTR